MRCSKTVGSAIVAASARREKVDHGPSVARNLSIVDSPCLGFGTGSIEPTFVTVPVGIVSSKSSSSWLWNSLSVLGIPISVSPRMSFISNKKADASVAQVGPLLESVIILTFWSSDSLVPMPVDPTMASLLVRSME